MVSLTINIWGYLPYLSSEALRLFSSLQTTFSGSSIDNAQNERRRIDEDIVVEVDARIAWRFQAPLPLDPKRICLFSPSTHSLVLLIPSERQGESPDLIE